MSNLVRLIYASKESQPFEESQVMQLLASIRANNALLGVTGMLLYDEGSFLQVLEGEESVIERLFKSITFDKRHKGVVKIINEAIPERQFRDWSMGYAKLTQSQLEKIEGMNDFFKYGSCLVDLDEGQAKRILNAFAEGRWRLQ